MMTPELQKYMDSLYDRKCVVIFGIEVGLPINPFGLRDSLNYNGLGSHLHHADRNGPAPYRIRRDSFG